MRMHPISYNGEPLARDEFAYRTGAGGGGFNQGNIVAIVFYCGNGKNRLCEIPIHLDQPFRGTWNWDGNMEKPTLRPSIGCDHRCGWHGSIENGELKP